MIHYITAINERQYNTIIACSCGETIFFSNDSNYPNSFNSAWNNHRAAHTLWRSNE